MESLNQLKNYFQTLHYSNFNKILYILNQMYPTTGNYDLNKKFELSLLVNQKDTLNARFGLFQLFNSNSIIKLFKDYRYDTTNLESLFSLMDGFAPEFGLGFDYKRDIVRIKTYFLRLQDNPDFNDKIILKINQISDLFNIDSEHLQNLKKEDCYLIGIDHYPSNKNNLKLYFRELDVNFKEIYKQLEDKRIDSRYILNFFSIFSENNFKDVTYSYKYSNQTDKLSCFSIFFETEFNLNNKIDKLIEISIPNKFKEFKSLIELLKNDGVLIDYSHIGITFSFDTNSESICLYYFPDFGGFQK